MPKSLVPVSKPPLKSSSMLPHKTLPKPGYWLPAGKSLASCGVGCARTLACSKSECRCGWQSPWPWIDPLDGSRRAHTQQEQKTLGLFSYELSSVLKGGSPRIHPFGQCRCRSIWEEMKELLPLHTVMDHSGYTEGNASAILGTSDSIFI